MKVDGCGSANRDVLPTSYRSRTGLRFTSTGVPEVEEGNDDGLCG